MSEDDAGDHENEPDSDNHEGERGDEFELERTATRAEAAAALRDLADGVDAGAVALGEGEDALTAAVPDAFEFEIEYERDDDEVEIEVELEWAPEDEPESPEPAATGDSEGDASTGDGGAERPDAADSDPAVETATVAAGDATDEDAASADTVESDGSEGEAATEEGESSGAGDDSAASIPSVDPGEGRLTESVVTAAAPVVSQARFELFRDRAAEWRWRLVHRNGNIIASSGEGYTRKHNAEKGMRSVMANAPDADVVED